MDSLEYDLAFDNAVAKTRRVSKSFPLLSLTERCRCATECGLLLAECGKSERAERLKPGLRMLRNDYSLTDVEIVGRYTYSIQSGSGRYTWWGVDVARDSRLTIQTNS